MIKEFLLANGLYDHNWAGARCDLCDKPCKSARGVKSHKRFCYFNNAGKEQVQQDFKNRKAEAAARTQRSIRTIKKRDPRSIAVAKLSITSFCLNIWVASSQLTGRTTTM